nr:hypothetical protein [Laribacter hongkongensis]
MRHDSGGARKSRTGARIHESPVFQQAEGFLYRIQAQPGTFAHVPQRGQAFAGVQDALMDLAGNVVGQLAVQGWSRCVHAKIINDVAVQHSDRLRSPGG